MLRIYNPELLGFNMDTATRIFDSIWPKYCTEKFTHDTRYVALRDEFYYASLPLFSKAFSVVVNEMFNCINLKTPLSLDSCEFDFQSVYDGYSHIEEYSVPDTFDIEETVLEFMCRVGDLLILHEFSNLMYEQLMPVYASLLEIQRQQKIMGFWVDEYIVDDLIYQHDVKAYGIQEGDFEPLWADTWTGASTSKLAELTMDDGYEFYWWDGRMVVTDVSHHLPIGVPVTLCRLTRVCMDKLGE